MNSALEFTIDVVVEPDGDEYYAYCPALKGLHVSGASEEEALTNAVNAAIAYLESLLKHGEPIPLTTVVQDAVPSPTRTHEGTHSHTRRFSLSLDQLQAAHIPL